MNNESLSVGAHSAQDMTEWIAMEIARIGEEMGEFEREMISKARRAEQG